MNVQRDQASLPYEHISTSSVSDLRIDEKDSSDTYSATYVETRLAEGGARVDVITPPRRKSRWQSLLNVFLPAGYPNSVTEDYLKYQIYDSLQAFSSSIAGLLSSRAVLEGVGVGDASASPTAALLLNVLQESMGRIATILFAHKLGTSLEPECKMYRLAADVFNDTAMILDCLSPTLPKLPRVILLSFSSVLRALCGVAAGSSKASLSAHFAKWGNLGELNAKDSSQETIISLLGMLAGSMVVSHVSSPFATWTWLVLLLAIHLGMNHAAVKAVSMHTLNRQRANLVMSALLEHGRSLTPDEASKKERVFERDGALRWEGSHIFARAKIGVSIQSLLSSLSPRHGVTGSFRNTLVDLGVLAQVYHSENYILWYDSRRSLASIVLKEGAAPTSQLKAWTHALWTAHRYSRGEATSAKSKDEGVLQLLISTLEELNTRWEHCIRSLKDAGWDLESMSLETTSATRIRLRPAPGLS